MDGGRGIWLVSEISLCWRSLNGEPVVWVGAGYGRKNTSLMGFYKCIRILLWKLLDGKRFYLDSSQMVLPVSVSRCGGLVPQRQSKLPAPPCPWLGLLCAGRLRREGTGFSITSKLQRRGQVKGRGWARQGCLWIRGWPPLPLTCQAAECWSPSYFFHLFQIVISFPVVSLPLPLVQ